MTPDYSDIAIVGAGMAGLSCATKLVAAGHGVRVFDKGRGPGGRMAARRAEIDGASVSFDHGAQYFTARDPAFLAAVEAWQQAGAAAQWAGAGRAASDPAWVGTPGMNGPIRAMSDALCQNAAEVLWERRVERLTRDADLWRIETDAGSYTAQTVLVAIPAEQAYDLLVDVMPQFASVAGSVVSEPCWAVMAAFSQRLPIEKDGLRDGDAAISWAARNSAKPGRVGDECWVLHASAARSRAIIDLPKEEAAAVLLADFFVQAGIVPINPIHLAAHRWLYAMPAAIDGEPARYDADLRIGMAGDFLHSPRVEGAWLSGAALAQRVLADR